MTDMEELLDLCSKLEVSVRINHKTGSIHIYEELGEYECVQQALLYLKTRWEEALEELDEE